MGGSQKKPEKATEQGIRFEGARIRSPCADFAQHFDCAHGNYSPADPFHRTGLA
jgi:hypothetical protein